MTKVTDAARLQRTDDFSYRHPLFVIGAGEFDDARMGATMDSYLNGYGDPRISSYFTFSRRIIPYIIGIYINIDKNISCISIGTCYNISLSLIYFYWYQI